MEVPIEKYAVENGAVFIEEGLMSLFHYFDCGEAMKRCEAVILADLNPKGCVSVWRWLGIIEKFQLNAALEPALASFGKRDERVKAGDANVESMVAELSPAMIVRVLAKLFEKLP